VEILVGRLHIQVTPIVKQPASRPDFRAAIIGAGLISDVHIAELRKLGIEVVGIVDSDFARAREKVEEHDTGRAYLTMRELFRDVVPDVVHVLTPPGTHAAVCEEAFAAGCHVYVEKPMACTEADCNRMIAAARKAERELCVGHNLVHDPLMQRVRQMLAAGELGELEHVSAVYSYDASRIPGFAGKWYGNLTGGFLEDLAAHPASLLVHLLGVPREVHRVAVPATGGDLRRVNVLVEAERGTGSIFVSMDARPEEVSVELRCTRATVTVNFARMTLNVDRERSVPRKLAHGVSNLSTASHLATQTLGAGARMALGKADGTKGIHSLIDAFYQSIRAGTSSPVPGEEGRRTVSLLRGIWPESERIEKRPSRRVIDADGKLLPGESLQPLERGSGGTALVTGATGFIGRHLVAELVKRGVTVRALARSQERARELAGPGVQAVVGDIADPAVFPGLADGVDVIYHLASVMRGSWASFQLVDIAGARRLLAEAKRAGVRRIVFTSTLAAYPIGEMADGTVVTEERLASAVPAAASPYARAKLAVERILLEAAARGDIEVVVMRPGLVFGPGSTPYLTHLPHLGVLRGNRYLVFGDGNVRLPLTYVGNTVDALILAAKAPNANGATFTVVDDNLPTQREYVAHLAQLTGRSLRVTSVPRAGAHLLGFGVESAARLARVNPPTTRRLLLGKTHKITFDCTRAREVLGWTPTVGWEEGLDLNVQWATSPHGRHNP